MVSYGHRSRELRSIEMRRRERKHAKMGMSKPGCMSFKGRMVTSKTLREEVGSVVQSRAISERTDR